MRWMDEFASLTAYRRSQLTVCCNSACKSAIKLNSSLCRDSGVCLREAMRLYECCIIRLSINRVSHVFGNNTTGSYTSEIHDREFIVRPRIDINCEFCRRAKRLISKEKEKRGVNIFWGILQWNRKIKRLMCRSTWITKLLITSANFSYVILIGSVSETSLGSKLKIEK